MTTYHIRIIYDDQKRHEKYKAVVVPGHCYVEPGDEIIFSTKETNAEITFPEIDKIFTGKNSPIEIEMNSESGVFLVSDAVKSHDEYPFAVYCKDRKVFAEGCTTPRIIID
jgi:hypothetical protein